MEILDEFKDKTPIFACIGTKKSFYDNTSNRIGYILKENGFNVVLNLNSVNMQNKLKILEKIQNKIENSFIIAIDLSVSENRKSVIPYKISKSGIKPGSFLNKKHKELGDVSIKIFVDYFEKVENDFDVLEVICKSNGNKKIHEIEKEIANKLINYYKNK